MKRQHWRSASTVRTMVASISPLGAKRKWCPSGASLLSGRPIGLARRPVPTGRVYSGQPHRCVHEIVGTPKSDDASAEPSGVLRVRSQPPDDHKRRRYPQHTVFLAVDVAAADPHPHPVPPVDFSSASSAQQALVPDGAGPPQQVCGAPPCASDVSAAPRFGVCDCVVSIMTDSWLWPASRRSTRKTGR